MESILPTSDYKEYEGRAYLDPEVALNESNQFIDNLRNTQSTQNQEIAKQTYNLGTSIPSAQGGLGTNTPGGLSYFTSRYQVPQTASVVSDLRATAQAAALNQVLANEQAAWKKRYNDAYRAYQSRANASNSGGSGGSGGGNDNSSTWQGDTKKNATDNDFIYWLGQDGNVWATKNGVTSNLGAAIMENGQWNGRAEGSSGAMDGNGTRIDDPNPGGRTDTPPNPDDYYITGEEQTQRISERSNLPEWLVNIMKTFK